MKNAPCAAARTALVVLLIALVPIAAGGQEVDPFYSRLLEDGIRAHARADQITAAEDLRIAAFGLMESPPRLARALTFLALAQSASGNVEGFEASFRRLAELETRFGAYSSASLDSTERAALDRAARSVLPPSELEAALLVAPVPASAAETEAKAHSTAASRPVAAPGTSPAPSPEQVAAFEALSQLAAGKGGTQKLRRGFEEARDLADLYPDWKEAQRVAGLLAARSASYPEAVTYYRRSGDPGDDEPVQLFYLSVALFETGKLEEAAEALRRALPELEQNREVRRYAQQILPEYSHG